MFELRILSGLHRGATLPLDERPLLIGADDDADVVLVDPDIATRHARLTLTAHGWSLSSLDGPILGADHNRPCTSLDLQAGDCARLGHVWLTVAEAQAGWVNPPAEPPHGDGDGAGDGIDDGAHSAAADDELYRDSPLDDAPPEPAPQPAAAAPPPPGPPPPGPPRKIMPSSNWRRSKMVLVPVALVTVLSACAAYQLTSGPAPKAGPEPLVAAPLPGVQATIPAPAPGVKMSQADLREALRNRLKEVDLLKRFDLDLKDNEWTLNASLDADEAARFERILKAFIHAHRITFPVHARVGSAESMLPFRIREVISGSNASVVTQDGNRLYVGDAYRGARLVAVDGRFLQFDGERKIKVKW